MPCSDSVIQEREDQQARQDELARLLCKICRNLELEDRRDLIPGEVLEWWFEHKKFDKEKGR